MIVPTLEVCSSASLICSILIQTKLLKALLQGSWQNLSHLHSCLLLSKSDFWRCALEHFNYGFFEEYSCKTITQIYLDKEYKLPFTIMDQSKVRVSPAVLTRFCFQPTPPCLLVFYTSMPRVSSVLSESNT